MNQKLQALFQQNRQDFFSTETRPSQYPGYSRRKRGSENIQGERQAARNRYLEGTQNILQNMKQGNSMKNI